MALVAPEAPSEQARRVFQTYDPEGKRFYFLLILFYIFMYLKYIDPFLSFIFKKLLDYWMKSIVY